VLISYGNYIRRVVADGGIDNTLPTLIYAIGQSGVDRSRARREDTGCYRTNPWKIRRFNSDGTPDNSFTSVDFGGGWILSIVEKQNGKIMTAGGFYQCG